MFLIHFLGYKWSEIFGALLGALIRDLMKTQKEDKLTEFADDRKLEQKVGMIDDTIKIQNVLDSLEWQAKTKCSSSYLPSNAQTPQCGWEMSLGKQSVWKTMSISISKEFGVVAKIVFNLHRYDSAIQDTENVIGLGFCADFVRLKLYFSFWTLKFRWIYWQIQSFQEMMAKQGRHGFQVALRDQRGIGPIIIWGVTQQTAAFRYVRGRWCP